MTLSQYSRYSKHNERRNRLGLKRAIKSKFLVALDERLYGWRQDAKEEQARKRRRLLAENPTAYIDTYGDIVSDDCSEDEYTEYPAKRRKKD